MSKIFRVENYKGIKGTIEVSSDGGSIIVQGKNGAGKSSFIDGITALFEDRGLRFTPEPIFNGGDYAKAELEDTKLDLRFEREWKKNEKGEIKSTLSVYSLSDGAKYSKPSELVAKVTGGLIFDPTKFLQADPKDQRDLLLMKVKFTDPSFNFLKNEQNLEAAEDVRRNAFQVKQAALGAVKNAEKPAPGTPLRPVSTADLVAELTKAKEANDNRMKLAHQVSSIDAQVENQTLLIEELERKLAEAKQQLTALESSQEELKKIFAATPDLIDTSGLEEQIQNVDEVNRNVQILHTLGNLEQHAKEKTEAWEAAVADVEEITQVKKEALASAIFPDPNLSIQTVSKGFDPKTGEERLDHVMMYGDVPFSQVNTASQRKAAFSIATAGNPELKLVIVKDGDLLDDESLAELDKVAVERGFDVLIERGRQDVGDLVATFVEMENGQRK